MAAMRTFLLALPLVWTLGCGDLLDQSPLGIKQARCDLRPKKQQCTDIRNFKGPSLITFEGVCETLVATTMSGMYEEDVVCDMTDAWGGCQSSGIDGHRQTNWFYKDMDSYPDEASAKTECESNMDWVPPEL